MLLMHISPHLAIIVPMALLIALFPANHQVLGLLCAFGCRELPAPQIVSSAQFRSFIMPRDVRLHGCIGCCGACGDGDGGQGGESSSIGGENGDDGVGGGGGGGNGAEGEKPLGSNPILMGMNAAAPLEHRNRVWYSTLNGGREGGDGSQYWRGRKL